MRTWKQRKEQVPALPFPGYELHYAWVLGGEERHYGAWADDPRHAWVKGSDRCKVSWSFRVREHSER